ncbi:MAG: hypothetical protein CVU06_14020 [Bacteroidetes bacterium HGW-Bacteroidetes-22]|nr:MAG: hypothetical protein CVU06_14020 [Bacteroidetes bacterium HGW-Bacteroidetes-22]
MRQHTRVIAAFFGPAIFDLFDEPMSNDQRRLLGIIGSCIPAFDMCFDDNLIGIGRLKSLVQQPFDFKPESGTEQLAAVLYSSLVQGVCQPNLLRSLTDTMFETEEKSRLQLSDETDFDTIRNITCKKGGTGGLFFTVTLPRQLSVAEQQAFYLLGSWVQLVDDLFDLRDDVLNGIRTPVTDCRDTATLSLLLSQWQAEAFDAVGSLALPTPNKRRFLAGFILYGKMANRYLQQVEQQIGKEPLSSFARVSAAEAEPSGVWKTLFD